MPSTVLEIVQSMADSISIPRPLTVVNSTDQQVRQLFALLKEEGNELYRSYPWQALNRTWLYTTVADEEQPLGLPDDIDRFIGNTQFDRTGQRQMIGPLTPQQWQAIKAQPVYASVFLGWVQKGGEILIQPTPPVGHELAYEYISNKWALSALGVPQTTFLADTDTSYLDANLLQYGLRWRFLAAKGLDYAEAMRTYERQKAQVQARDGGNTEIDISGRNYYWPFDNIPQGNFPGPT